MYIPESSVRDNNDVYEEISIPATTQRVPDTGALVSIDSLDEIGQMGFQVRRVKATGLLSCWLFFILAWPKMKFSIPFFRA